MLPPGNENLLVERASSRSQPQCLFYTTIGYVTLPRLSDNGAGGQDASRDSGGGDQGNFEGVHQNLELGGR